MEDTMVFSASSKTDALRRIQKLHLMDYIDEYDAGSLEELVDVKEVLHAWNHRAAFAYIPEETPGFFPASIASSEKARLAMDTFQSGDKMYVVGIEMRSSQWEDILELE